MQPSIDQVSYSFIWSQFEHSLLMKHNISYCVCVTYPTPSISNTRNREALNLACCLYIWRCRRFNRPSWPPFSSQRDHVEDANGKKR